MVTMYALAVFASFLVSLVESKMNSVIIGNEAKVYKLLCKMPKGLPVYLSVPIAIVIITLINIVIAVLVFVIHHKRRPREPTEQELDEIEAEEDEEEEEESSNNQGSNKDGKAGKTDKGGKGKKGTAPKDKTPAAGGKKSKGKNKKMKIQTKEFKFDGKVVADTETLKLVTAETDNGATGHTGTKTDLQSVLDTNNRI